MTENYECDDVVNDYLSVFVVDGRSPLFTVRTATGNGQVRVKSKDVPRLIAQLQETQGEPHVSHAQQIGEGKTVQVYSMGHTQRAINEQLKILERTVRDE